MLDIKLLRKNSVQIKNGLKTRNFDPQSVDKVLKLDKKLRDYIQLVEKIKQEKNKFNKTIPKLQNNKKSAKIKEITKFTKQEKKLEQDIASTKEKLNLLLKKIPNLPAQDVCQGKNENDNREIKKVGDPPKFNFQLKDYMEIAKTHDLIDTERAAKVSGSRFGYLKKEGALLWSALVQYSLGILLKENFIPFFSPSLIKKEIMENSGYNSYTEGQEAYYIEKDQLYLVGTGEHALLPYHSNEILLEKNLPLYYTTYSSCYRREAGSYGQDTKGILRVHQFDKQEMIVISTQKNSWSEFDHLIKIQEKIIQGLGLTYRLLMVCTGDLPKPSAKVIDLECWLPSEQKYRETHSASNCTDYQARTNKIRYKGKDGQTSPVHILNATCITPRTLIAILENYQQSDGSIKIPQVLKPYMHGISIIEKK